MYKAGKPWDVYITPHGISLLVLVDNWVTWDGLEETRSRLGFYIADSINVRTHFKNPSSSVLLGWSNRLLVVLKGINLFLSL
jgi:hypothetical protein